MRILRAREGPRHPPHRVNSRANIFALKELGITQIIGVPPWARSRRITNRRDSRPGQYIDFTKKREYTFYEGRSRAHIDGRPFCADIRNVLNTELKSQNVRTTMRDVHMRGGPQVLNARREQDVRNSPTSSG